jgi:hypothetical protein
LSLMVRCIFLVMLRWVRVCSIGCSVARFAVGNNYIGLNLQSAIGQQPWRFLYAYLANNPLQWPIGAERSVVPLTWYAVPYSVDPWNNGQGSYGVAVWDHTLDQ